MSRPSQTMVDRSYEPRAMVDRSYEPRVAIYSDLVLMNQAANRGELVEFEKMSKLFTSKIWEMRMFANANAYTSDHSRQFQICLQVANDMLLKDGFDPTTKMQELLTKIARSSQQKKTLEAAIQSWSTHATHASDASDATHASDGGRPKMRRQIRTRSRHRLNKSKKNRRRKVRRTRHKL